MRGFANERRKMMVIWEPVTEVNNRLMTKRDAVKAQVEKTKIVHYIPEGGGYTAILRNPKTAPSLDDIVDTILKICEVEDR